MSERYGNIEVETIGDLTVVRFLPRTTVTEENPEPFHQLLARLAAAPGAKIDIDFGNVRFFSSAALGVLILIHRRLLTTGGRLIVRALSPDLLDVFRITKLDRLFGYDPGEAGGEQDDDRDGSDEAADEPDDGGSAGVPARLRPPRPSGGAGAALPPPPPAEPGV